MRSNYRGGVNKVTLLERCRSLRESCTDAETLLWRLLRARQVAGVKFRRQHQYGSYILDFYCNELRIAIEVDGGQHFSAAATPKDAARTRTLEGHGIRVLRFTNVEVFKETEAVVVRIWEAVEPRLLT